MTPELRNVIRTAIVGFVTGATLCITDSLKGGAATIDMTWLRAIGFAALTAGTAGAYAALHSYVIDPSRIPSLAPPKQVPVAAYQTTSASGYAAVTTTTGDSANYVMALAPTAPDADPGDALPVDDPPDSEGDDSVLADA